MVPLPNAACTHMHTYFKLRSYYGRFNAVMDQMQIFGANRSAFKTRSVTYITFYLVNQKYIAKYNQFSIEKL